MSIEVKIANAIHCVLQASPPVFLNAATGMTRLVKLNEQDAASAALPPAQTPRVVESRELFRGGTEILIAHDGSIYRMKITRQGKLILNK